MCKIPTDYHELDTIYNNIVCSNLKIVGFSAATKGSGVTSLIKSLAFRFQIADQRVLIVDTNCHNPDFSRDNEATQWGEISFFEEGIDVIKLPVKSEDKRWLMQLKNNLLMVERLKVLARDYDVILMDTSALNNINRGNLPAERMLGNCDAVYLVVKAGVARRAEIIHAMTIISSNTLPLIGTVYNDVNNPSIAMELIREIKRLANRLPRISDWLKTKVQQSYLLNIKL